MPQVKLKLNRFLRPGFDSGSADLEEIPITAMEGESIFELARRLAAENNVFHKEIFDEKNQMIETNIVVLLNGRIVNPYERSNTLLREGDEITFISMLYGG